MDPRLEFESPYSQVPSAGASFSASPSAYTPFTPPSNRAHEPTIHVESSYSHNHSAAMSFGMSPSPISVPDDSMKHQHEIAMYHPDARYQQHSLPLQISAHQHYPTHHLDMGLNSYGTRPYDVSPMGHQQHMGVDTLGVMGQYSMGYGGAPMAKTGSISSISSGGQLSPVSPTASSHNAAGPYHSHMGMMNGNRTTPTPHTSVDSLLNSSPSPTGAAWMQAAGAPRQMYLTGAQHSTGALRQIQDYGLAPHLHQTSSNLRNNGIEVSQVSRGRHACQEPGCTKAFKRAEHLKRHYATAHNPQPEWQTCPFCPSTRRFLSSRIDNYRQHIRLHTIENKSPQSRVGFHPKAAELLHDIESQMKRRGTRKNRDLSDLHM